MVDKGELAISAAKLALKGAVSDTDEDGEPKKPSWAKRGFAAAAGVLSVLYFIDAIIGIPGFPISKLHYLFPTAIILWSMAVWGVGPSKFMGALRRRRERKKLAAAARG